MDTKKACTHAGKPHPTFVQATAHLQVAAATHTAIDAPHPLLPSLTGIPANIFIFITSFLPARDTGRLSLVAQQPHQYLHEAGVLQRSRDIAAWSIYDDDTQTLNFGRIPAFREVDSAQMEKYRQALVHATDILNQYPDWAKAHIKTVIFPLESMFTGNLLAELNEFVSCLEGIRHLVLCYQPGNGVADRQLTPADKDNLFQHLLVLKKLPVEQVTLSDSFPIAKAITPLCQAINEGLFYSGIKTLAFSNDDPDSLFYQEEPITIEDGVYPNLTVLDFSGAPQHEIHLHKLPASVKCLRTTHTTRFMGNAPFIERWEILYQVPATRQHQRPDLSRQSIELAFSEGRDILRLFATSAQALPALQSVYIVPPRQPELHTKLLANILLGLSPAQPLSIQFASLHLYKPFLLEEILQKSYLKLHLPAKMTFHIMPSDVQDFRRQAQTGRYRELEHIQYQLDKPDYSPVTFAKMLAMQLENGTLPKLRHFTIKYQYGPQSATQASTTLRFLDGEGKRLYRDDTRHLSLQTLLGQASLAALQQSFFEAHHTAEQATGKHAASLISLQQTFGQIIAQNMPVAMQDRNAMQWIIFLEQVHTQLYSAYIHQLQQDSTASLYQHALPGSFQQTALGKQVITRIHKHLMQYRINELRHSLTFLLPVFQLRTSIDADISGFRLHFSHR